MKISIKEGAGGMKMQKFLLENVLKIFGPSSVGDIGLEDLDDGASFDNYVITTDGHTIKPLFFRGGDIGKLATCGTINDVSVMGAKPLLLTSSLIIQAGFESLDLERIFSSMKEVCKETGVKIIAGDTKVVEDGIGLYVTTTGVGKTWKGLTSNLEIVRKDRDYPENFITDHGFRPGDKIIFSGNIGDHGISVMSEREELSIAGNLSSDVAPVWDITRLALDVGGITAMKDPTRGGVATALNEMAGKSGTGAIIYEKDIPVNKTILAAADILGINYLDVANEGKVIIGVMSDFAEDVLSQIKKSRYGKDAAIVGEVIEDERVFLKTKIGTKRLLTMPEGDPVPRVC